MVSFMTPPCLSKSITKIFPLASNTTSPDTSSAENYQFNFWEDEPERVNKKEREYEWKNAKTIISSIA